MEETANPKLFITSGPLTKAGLLGETKSETAALNPIVKSIF